MGRVCAVQRTAARPELLMPRERREQKRKPWSKRRKEKDQKKVSTELRCPTGKPAFPSEEVAMGVLIEIRGNPGARIGGELPERVYRCEVCPHWHLTSQTHHRGVFVGRYEDAS